MARNVNAADNPDITMKTASQPIGKIQISIKNEAYARKRHQGALVTINRPKILWK